MSDLPDEPRLPVGSVPGVSAAPVASLDELGESEGQAGVTPVASFEPGRVGAARNDVPVADLGRAVTRRDRQPGRDTGRDVQTPDADREPDSDADPLAVARAICLRLLTERARSRHELAEALRRRGVPAAASRAVLERFGEVGLINDALFAEQWVHSRHTGKGLGRRALVVELRHKGIADDVAGGALEEIDTEAEERRARQLVDRKLRGVPLGSRDERANAARRLAGMLARKGYGPGVAYRVVREAIVAHGADAEELGPDSGFED